MRERQAAQMAAALIFKAGRPVGKLRLLKLMYLVERESMLQTGFPITFDEVFAMRQGMALSRTWNLMLGVKDTPTNGEWEKHIVRTNRGLMVKQGVGAEALDSLSPKDNQLIGEVWKLYGKRSRDDLIDLVHHKLAEWESHWRQPRKSDSVLVPYETLYQTVLGLDLAQASEAAEEVAYFQAMNDPNRV